MSPKNGCGSRFSEPQFIESGDATSPRKAKVRWHKAKRCWYACIGERDAKGRAREVYPSQSIGPDDDRAALDWFDAEKKRRELDEFVTGDETVDWVCERDLAWAQKRRDEGHLDPLRYVSKERPLGIFADAIGSRVARAPEPADLSGFGEAMLGTYSPAYARNLCRTVYAAFNWAAGPGKLLVANRLRRFRAPTISARRRGAPRGGTTAGRPARGPASRGRSTSPRP